MKNIPTWLKVLAGGAAGAGVVAGLCALFGKKTDSEDQDASEEVDYEVDDE